MSNTTTTTPAVSGLPVEDDNSCTVSRKKKSNVAAQKKAQDKVDPSQGIKRKTGQV
ncbi:hypothetical protein DPMN_083706 [Dreissena polymorpha]|uniref:Uncharacterized protein n=1 Tax=Dreissena polymorpha TaxID=45954 RepID=A0A9D3YBT0_DREPO|nr:hypothetical protein DPMN_083706 [Dreissena polymorpha]